LGAAFLVALPAALSLDSASLTGGPREAHAAVALLVSMDELVGASAYVVVAQAGERSSVWEDLPGGRRIVTYTRFKVERAVVGSPGSEVVVRTLGGVVGTIGQAVSGEAKIATGERSLLFLAKSGSALVMTGLAQGHFPIAVDAKGNERLKASPDAGTLLPRPGPVIAAREELVGALVDDAARVVERAKRARQARDAK
jgi:hypothetical protein